MHHYLNVFSRYHYIWLLGWCEMLWRASPHTVALLDNGIQADEMHYCMRRYFYCLCGVSIFFFGWDSKKILFSFTLYFERDVFIAPLKFHMLNITQLLATFLIQMFYHVRMCRTTTPVENWGKNKFVQVVIAHLIDLSST